MTDRNEARSYVSESILSSSEAVELLGFSRQYLQQLVQEGRIKRLKGGTYLKSDIEWYKNQRGDSNDKN